MDTVRIIERYIDQQQYIDLLLQLNEQLSFRWTPINTAVGVLSVLVGLLAIGGGFLLYRQSQDHQRQIDRFLRYYDSTFQDYLSRTEARFEEIVGQLRQQATEQVDEQAKAAFERAAKRIEELTPRPAERSHFGISFDESLGQGLGRVWSSPPVRGRGGLGFSDGVTFNAPVEGQGIGPIEPTPSNTAHRTGSES